MNKVLQCCYTNAVEEVNGTVVAGWKPVAASQDLPPEAYKTCVRFQNANSAIQNEVKDEKGNVLNLLEICGDGSYLYMIRTQFGLQDRLGRANMFSHAFVFSWKDEEFLSDPNSFLTIDNSNFKDNEAAAAQIPEALARTAPFELRGAMQAAGITAESYVPLVRCVFAQMTEKKIGEPLFIQYDGTERQMRAILYCIYYALPYYLRKTLCCASAVGVNAANKNIIFSEFADKHQYYIDPKTGANSILSDSRLERKIKRYRFVDYIPMNAEKVDDPTFFKRLETMANWLGDPTASDELIMKIAFQMFDNPTWYNVGWEKFEAEDVDARLSDALRSKSYGSPAMERYIASLLEDIYKRRMLMTDESEAYLADRLATATSEQLKKAAEQYNIFRFSTLSIDEAAQKLGRMDPAVFAQYAATLMEIDRGPEILDAYFANVALENRSAMSWEYLDTVLERSRFIAAARPQTRDKADKLAWELYCQAVSMHGDISSDYAAYMSIMREIVPGEQLARCGEAAKEEYWNQTSFKSYDTGRVEERLAMRTKSRRCELFLYFDKLASTISRGEESFLENTEWYFSQFGETLGDELPAAAKLLLQEVKLGYQGGDPSFTDWVSVVILCAGAQDLGRDALEIRTALRRGELEELPGMLAGFSGRAVYVKESKTLLERLSGVAASSCKEWDAPARPVSLDVWLSLGKMRGGNSFRIFDKIKPEILAEEPGVVVEESSLISGEQYCAEAEEYVQQRGEEAKTVNKWLGELKQMEKKRRAEEKKNNPAAPGGGLFGMFSRGEPKKDKEKEPKRESAKDGESRFGFFNRKKGG